MLHREKPAPKQCFPSVCSIKGSCTLTGWARGASVCPNAAVPPSLHPVAFVKLRLVLGVGVLHSDASRQNGGHIVPDALVFSLLLSLLLHFSELDTFSDGFQKHTACIADRGQVCGVMPLGNNIVGCGVRLWRGHGSRWRTG